MLVVAHYIQNTQHKFFPIERDTANFMPIMSEIFSFISLIMGVKFAVKGPMSFTFGHTHPGIAGTKSLSVVVVQCLILMRTTKNKGHFSSPLWVLIGVLAKFYE